MPAHRLLGDLGQADPLDHGEGAEEEALDEGRRQANRVENLRPAIGLVGRDAHLGHHLEQPLVDRLDEAFDDLVFVDLLGQPLLHRRQRLEGEIRVDGLGAIAGEAAEMMDLAWLAGLDHQADRSAQSLADEVMMHRRRRQQRRDRDAVRPDHAVRQDDDVVAAMHGGLGALAQTLQGALHALGALLGGVGGVQRLGVEGVFLEADAADFLEVLVGEDRLAHLEPLLARGALEIEQVRPRPDEGDEAHDQLLADRVDRRVRHLREVLLEIGVEQLGARGERRDRRVGAHRADRLLAGHGHRRHQQLEVLLRVAERLLAIEQRHVRARFRAAERGANPPARSASA